MNDNAIIIRADSEKTINKIMKECSGSFYNQKYNDEEIICNMAYKFFCSGEFLYAKINDVICGFVSFYANDEINHIGYLSMIVVKKDFQNMKIGKMLLQKCIMICQKRGMKSIVLEVECTNAKAISIYKRNGFRELKTMGVSQCMKKDIGEWKNGDY